MKKIFTNIIVIFLAISVCYASEVSTLLDKAKQEYELGNLAEALQYIDEAKKMIEAEIKPQNTEEYREITSWDIVKLKKNDYIGKKVKITTRLSSIHSDGTAWLVNIGMNCRIEEQVIDSILQLEKYKDYTFYGTVCEDRWLGPQLSIEYIE